MSPEGRAGSSIPLRAGPRGSPQKVQAPWDLYCCANTMQAACPVGWSLRALYCVSHMTLMVALAEAQHFMRSLQVVLPPSAVPVSGPEASLPACEASAPPSGPPPLVASATPPSFALLLLPQPASAS